MNTTPSLRPIDELFDMDKIDLHEIHERLWYEYFKPAKPHPDKTFTRLLSEQMNMVAGVIRKRWESVQSGLLVVNVTPDMRWIMKPNDDGPRIKKPIYVDTITFSVFANKPKPVNQLPVRLTITVSEKRKNTTNNMPDLMVGKKKKRVSGLKKFAKKQDGFIGNSSKDRIVSLFVSGQTQQQIIDDHGFNRNTVVPVLWKYKKSLLKQKQ